jgi:UDP-N-acetylmuramyl pentapeptide phosphotransferase/UDP-N-acetylglucosamine-1-phosphate transferase
MLDNPNQRSSHISPTPRGGGLAFVVVGTILNFIFNVDTTRWIPVYCLPLALIGFVDDYKDLPAGLRYIMQAFTAIILLSTAKFNFSYWELLICILLITAIINFFNFMDGLDGLVAGCAIPIFAVSSGWSLSGAIFGFILWNWSPARIFMGDVGSTFIGAVFVGFALQQPTEEGVLSLILLAFPLIADAGTCIIRRLFNRQNIFKAHRKHLYQRLQRSGWSHSHVATLYISAVALLGFISFFQNYYLMFLFIIIEFSIGVFLDQSVASKFSES